MSEVFNQTFIDEVQAKYPDVQVNPSTHLARGNYQHGWKLVFPNGFTASIQFHPYSYCSNRSREHENFMYDYERLTTPDPSLCETSEDAEIAGWFVGDDNMRHFEGWEDNVLGWQTSEEVMKWIDENANQKVHITSNII
jgi:hypothetical protein